MDKLAGNRSGCAKINRLVIYKSLTYHGQRISIIGIKNGSSKVIAMVIQAVPEPALHQLVPIPGKTGLIICGAQHEIECRQHKVRRILIAHIVHNQVHQADRSVATGCRIR